MTLSELLNLFSALYSLSNDPKELLKKVNQSKDDQLFWCTFSYDQIDLNFKNPEVLLEFIKLILKLAQQLQLLKL